ncbi:MAG: helix-turn-helix domain-containing protein [Parvularculaceae bacterium]|nr:helix-turn-helix domain-containing protein [Parvularculaceae bacterium]
MANNIRDLRVAFLLTPRQLAERMGTYPQQVYRLEASSKTPSIEWVEAVARALDVPENAVTDPDFDVNSLALTARAVSVLRRRICPIGARFAIQAIVARLGGMKLALALSEDDLATAVVNLIAYVEAGEDSDEGRRANRLSQSLQIVALAILQGHGIVLDPKYVQALTKLDQGASQLIRSFSEIGEDGCEQVV